MAPEDRNSDPSESLLPTSIELSNLPHRPDKSSDAQTQVQDLSIDDGASSAQAKDVESAIPTRRRLNHLGYWWWELIAVIFSLACLAATACVLVEIDQKLYSDWRIASVDLTPNTLIAILAIVSKGSLLVAVAEGISQLKWLYFGKQKQKLWDLQVFDQASRGMTGYARLLCSVNWRVNCIHD